ncbi:MAG: amidase [Hyphomicrobiaceae bacterium]
MTDPELCYLPASEALRLFRARKLSPVELMKAVVARAEASQPAINAFTFRYFEEALGKARIAEARYHKGHADGDLEGLPVAVKDESYIKGYPTTNASALMRDFVPDRTSPTNERLLEAGVIVHGRTATPEFSCAGFTHSKMWGVTRNPWNLDCTPGGSSGGSGAVLAAGATTLATGSDIGGSIRIPASICGVVGFKPPYGRNPDDPPFNLDFYNHTGPMARTVEDTILLQNVMSGPHPLDIATVKPKLTLPTRYPGLKGVRIAASIDLGMFTVDPEIERNTRAALDLLRDLGATVEEVDLGWDEECRQAGLDYLSHLFGALMLKYRDELGDEMNPYAIWFAEQSRKSSVLSFLKSLETAGRMYQTLGPLLDTYDALVCPTLAATFVPANMDYVKNAPFRIAGKEVDPALGWAMTTCFNTMSRCPVLAVPSGHATNGVPTGIQIVGPTYTDENVFRIGMAYEAAAGPWYGTPATRPTI